MSSCRCKKILVELFDHWRLVIGGNINSWLMTATLVSTASFFYLPQLCDDNLPVLVGRKFSLISMSMVLVPKAQQQSDYVLFNVEHPRSQAALAKGYMDGKWTTFKFLSQSFCHRLSGCRALKLGFLFTNNFSSEHSSNANSMSHPQLVSTCWKCLLTSQLVCVKVFLIQIVF